MSGVQDSNQVSANMDKINFWSIVHMTLILIVGIIQVKRDLYPGKGKPISR